MCVWRRERGSSVINNDCDTYVAADGVEVSIIIHWDVYLRSVQVGPLYSGGHSQKKDSHEPMHLPPLVQGLGEHWASVNPQPRTTLDSRRGSLKSKSWPFTSTFLRQPTNWEP